MVVLPIMAQFLGLDANNLIFNDYTLLVAKWIQTQENQFSQHV